MLPPPSAGLTVVDDIAHLRRLLDSAAAGVPPPADASTVLVTRRPGLAVAGVFGFTAHHVVAAEVEPGWVEPWLAADPFAVAGADFVAALAARTGARPGPFDVLLVIDGEGRVPADVGLAPLTAGSHSRLRRARRFREEVAAYRTADGHGFAALGRGVAGRLEAAFEIDPARRDRGRGRALVSAIAATAPAGQPVYLQCAPGNVASLRAILAAGARPIGSELLISTGGDH